ncbi:MAG: 5-(carboxyamino)imidazole ribonucleotide synthase [Synechococcaceae cyanobacterium]|nr:5-(carboxyamino)imidazole ribonucleotide synthase [Synechococcaceae cyanobacterium]
MDSRVSLPSPAGGNGPAKVIGIVGGGQLARMLGEAARELGVGLEVQTPGSEDPALAFASGQVVAAVDDPAGTAELARRCSAISFENEWIPIDALEPLAEGGVRFLPSLDALRPLIDKRSQRELLDGLHLPCPRWIPLAAVLEPPQAAEASVAAGQAGVPLPSSPPALPTRPGSGPHLPEGFRFPLMAKAVRGGYDGKGTRPLADQAGLEELLEQVDPAHWILEEQVAFDCELALTACRDREGSVACFPLVQTHQHRQVCDWVLFPAPVNHAVEAFARNVAASLLTALDYVGVLSIEFFYGHAGLQVNELAPRTHNSGHYTIEACRCSQFAQQVRLVAGLPMGLTDPIWPGALMVNLLGLSEGDPDQDDRLRRLAALPGAHLHWYDKQGASPGRKLGHLTLKLDGLTAEERAREMETRLAEVRTIWPLPQDEKSAVCP